MQSFWQSLKSGFRRQPNRGLAVEIEALLRQARQSANGGAQNATIYLGDHTALTRLRSGHKIYVDTRDAGIAAHLMMDGVWEPWVEQVLIPAIKPGMNFCDIGANFGYYTLLGAQAVGPEGKVFSFECNPRLVSLLRRSIMIDGLASIVTLSGTAVSAAEGQVTLTFDEEFSGGGTTLEVRHVSQWTRKSANVPCAPLDKLIPEDAPIHVMKVDVEGAEPLVVQGATRVLSNPALKTLVIEYYAPSIARTMPGLAFLEKLASFGFTLHMLSERGVEAPQAPAALAETIGMKMVYLLCTRA